MSAPLIVWYLEDITDSSFSACGALILQVLFPWSQLFQVIYRCKSLGCTLEQVLAEHSSRVSSSYGVLQNKVSVFVQQVFRECTGLYGRNVPLQLMCTVHVFVLTVFQVHCTLYKYLKIAFWLLWAVFNPTFFFNGIRSYTWKFASVWRCKIVEIWGFFGVHYHGAF